MNTGIIVAIFPSRNILTRALDHLIQIDLFDIKRAAIVSKADNGETIILDDDLSADEGGIAGGTLGAAMMAIGMVQLGALAIPGVGPIIAIGAGALVGGLVGRTTGRFAANLLDFGFKNEQLEILAQNLQAGHPALVLQIDDKPETLAKLRKELKDYRVELIEPLTKATSTQMMRAVPPDEAKPDDE